MTFVPIRFLGFHGGEPPTGDGRVDAGQPPNRADGGAVGVSASRGRVEDGQTGRGPRAPSGSWGRRADGGAAACSAPRIAAAGCSRV
jgi:hypothetical protein